MTRRNELTIIEENEKRDIEAGKRVGCRTVGIGEDSANSGADYWVPTVKSLSQSEWVEKLWISKNQQYLTSA